MLKNNGQMTMDDAVAFFVGQLANLEEQAYSVEYPLINYAELIPVDTSANEWSDAIGFTVLDSAAVAEWISDETDKIPFADVKRSQQFIGVEDFGIGYKFNKKEINQAALAGVPLESERAEAAREGSEEFLDRIAFLGDKDKGVPGFLTDQNVPKATAAVGASTSYNWTIKTPLEIIFDLNDAMATVWQTTKERHIPDTIALPSTMYALIVNLPMSADNPLTVLNYFRENNLYTSRTGKPVTILTSRYLEKFPDDVAQTTFSQRMVLYTRNPRMVKMHLPMPFQFMEMERKGLVVEVPGMGRTAGVEWRMPLTGFFVKIQDAV